MKFDGVDDDDGVPDIIAHVVYCCNFIELTDTLSYRELETPVCVRKTLKAT